MRLILLGTGSADGWPNPFCACDSCESERAGGRSRRQSSALIDGRILIDIGGSAPEAARAAGLSLRDVEHVLVTHGHPDHLDPAFLLARRWGAPAGRLHIWGPEHAIALCRDWLAPGDPVSLHVIAPGDERVLATTDGEYQMRALPASHARGDGDRLAEEALLYLLADAGGQRLLYATDTGELSPAALTAIVGRLDAVLVDETFGDRRDHPAGHLDLDSLANAVRELRATGAIDDRTRVIATHLGHDNPPSPVLRERLRGMDVELHSDLSVVDTRERASARRLLVLGGARSGKSTHAEHLAASWQHEVTYVATGGDRNDDPEWRARVAEHRARRPAHWRTVETTDLPGTLSAAPAGSVLLIDCVTLWLTAVLDEIGAWDRLESAGRIGTDGLAAQELTTLALAAVARLVEQLTACAADVILVSNEVGQGVVPATSSGRLFRDLMGRVNVELASACTESVFVVAGRALRLADPPGSAGHR